MSLILYTKPTEPKQTTPFGEFLMHLQTAYGAVGETNAGAIQWTRFPVSTTVSSGLWLVMFSISERLGQSLTTMQEVSVMSAMINRMIEAGMIIRHGSPLEAAVAFGKQVIDPLHRAIALGYRPGTLVEQGGWQALLAGNDTGFRAAMTQSDDDSLAAFVQTPSGMFFADLFRAARITGERLGEEARKVNADDTLDHALFFRVYGTNGGDVPGYSSVLVAEQLSNMLTIRKAEPPKQFAQTIGDKGQTELRAIDWRTPLLALDALLRDARQIQIIQDALRQLPVQLNNLPKHVSAFEESIAGAWLNTQILLAAGGYPVTREHILFSEISRAIAEITTHRRELIENVFWVRMEKRSRGIRARIRPVLADILLRRIDLLRGFQNAGSMEEPPILCEYDGGGGIDPLRAMDMIDSGTIPTNAPGYDEQVLLPSIPWETLTKKDVSAIVRPKFSNGGEDGEFTDIDNIIPYFKKLKGEVKRHAVDLALQHHGKDAVNALLKESLTRLTPDILVAYVRDIEQEHLVTALPALLRKKPKLGVDAGMNFATAIVIAIGRAGEAVRPVLSRLELRRQIATTVFCVVRFETDIVQEIGPSDIKRFRAAVGEELFWPYLVSTEVIIREESLEQEGELILTSWVSDGESITHSGAATERELRKQFRIHTEEKSFLWLHEASPTKDEDLKKYKEALAERIRTQKAAKKRPSKKKSEG